FPQTRLFRGFMGRMRTCGAFGCVSDPVHASEQGAHVIQCPSTCDYDACTTPSLLPQTQDPKRRTQSRSHAQNPSHANPPPILDAKKSTQACICIQPSSPPIKPHNPLRPLPRPDINHLAPLLALLRSLRVSTGQQIPVLTPDIPP